MIAVIDKKLLVFFQKLSDWFQVWFGINNFAIAKFLVGFSIFSFLIEKISDFYLQKGAVFSFVSLVFSIFFTYYIFHYIKKGERSCKNNPVFTNPNVVELELTRLLMCFMLVCLGCIMLINLVTLPTKNFYQIMKDIFYQFEHICAVSAIYLACCTPRPPSRSKISKLKESVLYFGKSPQPVSC